MVLRRRWALPSAPQSSAFSSSSRLQVSGFGSVRGRPVRQNETIQTGVPAFCADFGNLFGKGSIGIFPPT